MVILMRLTSAASFLAHLLAEKDVYKMSLIKYMYMYISVKQRTSLISSFHRYHLFDSEYNIMCSQKKLWHLSALVHEDCTV